MRFNKSALPFFDIWIFSYFIYKNYHKFYLINNLESFCLSLIHFQEENEKKGQKEHSDTESAPAEK